MITGRGEVTAMATHDESSVSDLPQSLTFQEVYTLENQHVLPIKMEVWFR